MLGRERGFSLIEVLVTVAIFSIGLLAIAGLQSVSKAANFESLQRSTASQIAYSILEDMRMNGDALAAYTSSAPLGGNTISTEPTPNCRNPAVVCTASQRAAHDLWVWEGFVDGDSEILDGRPTGGLVTPTVCISGSPIGEADTYSVTIVWRGSVELSSSQTNSCGSGSGKYGSGDENRRLLQVSTFIDPNI